MYVHLFGMWEWSLLLLIGGSQSGSSWQLHYNYHDHSFGKSVWSPSNLDHLSFLPQVAMIKIRKFWTSGIVRQISQVCLISDVPDILSCGSPTLHSTDKMTKLINCWILWERHYQQCSLDISEFFNLFAIVVHFALRLPVCRTCIKKQEKGPGSQGMQDKVQKERENIIVHS